MPPSTPARRALALDLLAISLLAAALVWPLFRVKYMRRWGSIESTFISDGRFLHDHWPHPQWQPLWYCGTRYDYLYPPVLRYATATLSRIWIPVKAYHFFIALMYALGIAGVYFLVRILTRSRAPAWLAAAAIALTSPAILFIPALRPQTPHITPWRLWVLIQYGEGPHISSLAWLTFALGFAFLALAGRRPACLIAAACFSALVALTNFYGATSLAVFYAILVWTVWVTHRDRRIWLRAAAIPALAYALSAFWLVPSYVTLTVRNMALVSAPGTRLSPLWLIAVLALFALATLPFRPRPQHASLIFAAGAAFFFGSNVLAYTYFKLMITGNPERLIPEFEFALIVLAVELLRRLASVPRRLPRALAACLILYVAVVSRHYLLNRWELFPPDRDYRQRVEYQLSEWIATHLPDTRTMVTGSFRFWWDAWHDLPQVSGGSDQGVLNPHVTAANWELTLGYDPEMALRWLATVGAGAVVVPDKTSPEIFHDFQSPAKFAALTVLYDDHQGDIVYQVPRRYPSLARVVDRARLQTLRPPGQIDLPSLRAYTAVIEEGPDAPTTTAWQGTDRMRVHARVEAGQSVLVQVTYDPAWHAYSAGRPLPVHPDPAGFSAIDPPPGDHDIDFVFETPLENYIGRLLTLLTLGAILGWLLYSGALPNVRESFRIRHHPPRR